MLLEAALITTGLGYIFGKTDQAMKMDERARHKYAHAYEMQAEAKELVEKRKSSADKALVKVVNRKKAILTTSMSDFLTLYKKIIKINFLPGDGIKELENSVMVPVKIESMHNMGVLAVQQLSDSELVRNFLVSGAKGVAVNGAAAMLVGASMGPIGIAVGVADAIGGSITEDSRRNLSNANKQVKVSNVIYSQAENLGTILDAITERSNRIATVLAKLNALFVVSIKKSTELVDKNGSDRKAYSEEDRIALKTCINLADAVKKIIDVPLFDKEGLLTEDTLKVLAVGEEFLQGLSKI